HSAHPQLHPFPTRRSSDLTQTRTTVFMVLLQSNGSGWIGIGGIRIWWFWLADGLAQRRVAGRLASSRRGILLMTQQLAEYPDLGDRKSTRLNSSHLGISYA